MSDSVQNDAAAATASALAIGRHDRSAALLDLVRKALHILLGNRLHPAFPEQAAQFPATQDTYRATTCSFDKPARQGEHGRDRPPVRVRGRRCRAISFNLRVSNVGIRPLAVTRGFQLSGSCAATAVGRSCPSNSRSHSHCSRRGPDGGSSTGAVAFACGGEDGEQPAGLPLGAINS